MTESIRARRSADMPTLAGGDCGRFTEKEGLAIAPIKNTATRIIIKELRCLRVRVNLTPLIAIKMSLMPPNLRPLILPRGQILLCCESQAQRREPAQLRQSEDRMVR